MEEEIKNEQECDLEASPKTDAKDEGSISGCIWGSVSIVLIVGIFIVAPVWIGLKLHLPWWQIVFWFIFW